MKYVYLLNRSVTVGLCLLSHIVQANLFDWLLFCVNNSLSLQDCNDIVINSNERKTNRIGDLGVVLGKRRLERHTNKVRRHRMLHDLCVSMSDIDI